MSACQKCGGEIQGWVCQGCGQSFGETGDGKLVFDSLIPAAPSDVAGVVERLRRKAQTYEKDGNGWESWPMRLVNPDGPKAATLIQSLSHDREVMREALDLIAEGHDVGRHDGLPEDGPAHDADTMFAVARAALASLKGGA